MRVCVCVCVCESVCVCVCVRERVCFTCLHLLGPVVELFADQQNEFRVTERKKVNDLIDPPQKLVPSEMSL